MTMLEAIQEANDTAKIRNLSFANIQEFQSFLESFRFDDFPANVVVPFTFNGKRRSGTNKSVVPLQGWVLQRIPEDTNDYRSIKIQERYMEPMRLLAIKFINAILDTDIIDPEKDDIDWSVKPEYAFLPSGLFGCSYTANIPIDETICTY